MTRSFDPSGVALPIGHWIHGKYVECPGRIELLRPPDGAAYFCCPIADAVMVDRLAKQWRST
ncbi:hypothetical protein [Rhizobium lusitanum]|uniref:hypothetical protein n=1 Tax=Rhizobium lusitanum TaxID=293958 RepID=UPI00195B691F|nr:hypothetical protein [Rhizobium lusitanum]MBM7047165.1 hypothetical protein [Rhizobium lusitanum]